MQYRFNAPPGWPTPPAGWVPPEDWRPDPSWPPAPADWEFWLPGDGSPASGKAIADTMAPSPAHQDFHAELDAAVDEGAIAGANTHGPAVEEASDIGRTEVEELRAEVERLRRSLADTVTGGPDAAGSMVELDDERVLQDVGIYRYHHPLESAAAYKDWLADLQGRVRDMVVAGEAILAADTFTYNNSLAKGRRMTADLSKLMLRAYNAEADNCVRALRAGNVVTAKQRLTKAAESIAKLGAMMEMRVNPGYHDLRVGELELTADFLMKVQEEKEAAREERERLREERKVEQELAAQREKLDKERAHYLAALAKVRGSGSAEEVAELEAKVAAVDDAIEQNDYRAANIRAGYVYVISNEGAFGPNVVKIGLTRRLEPMDRVRELGDASVPFPFDVHALFFSDDAVSLENELHKHFDGRRVNHVNQRREFFFATPQEVREVLVEKVGNLLHFDEHVDATDYRQSKGSWPEGLSTGPLA